MRVSQAVLSLVCVALLSGCSWLEEWPPAEREFTKRAPQPQPRVMQTANATWLAPDNTVPLPVDHNGPQTDEAAMDRLAKLEKDVAAMRNDMSMMLPALTRLAQVQNDLQTILQNYQPAAGAAQAPVSLQGQAQPQVYQPQTQTQQNSVPVSPAPMAAYQPSAHAAPPSYQPPPQAASSVFVQQVRFGEHGDKTRLVLDVSGTIQFRYDVDNNENILMISLPTTAWQGMTRNILKKAPLVASYSAVSDGRGGTQMIIQLRRPVEVLWAQSMPPAAGKGHRIVIDIAGL